MFWKNYENKYYISNNLSDILKEIMKNNSSDPYNIDNSHFKVCFESCKLFFVYIKIG